MPADPSDEELMVAYMNGDEQALEALYRRYDGRLTAMFRRGGLSESDAIDLLQQTFLQLHRARRDFRTDAKLRPWLYTIARNLKREHYRRRSRKPETQLDFEKHPEPSFEPQVGERFEHKDTVRRAVASLPDSQREVIELHWFDELSFKEVAAVVGASLSAVKVRAHRGYNRLRGLLQEQGRNL